MLKGLYSLAKNYIFNKIDEAVISTNDIDQLLDIAKKYDKFGKFRESFNTYSKIFTIDPYHIEATFYYGQRLFAGPKTKPVLTELLRVYDRVYKNYYLPNNDKYRECTKVNQLYLSSILYQYGFILSSMNRNEEAQLIKKESLMNLDFAEKYKEDISAINY